MALGLSHGHPKHSPIRDSKKTTLQFHASAKTLFVECFVPQGMNKLDGLPFRAKLLSSLHKFWAVRCLGGAPDGMMIASERADFWIEPAAAPWDPAPLYLASGSRERILTNCRATQHDKSHLQEWKA